MNRRVRASVLILAVVALLAPLLATILVERPGAAAARPNVVLIVVDDLDSDSIRFMPNVGELLQTEGTTFTRFFATTPLCCPSRVSILRGQYAHNHGVLSNTGVDGGFPTFYKNEGEESTLATWLDDVGYRTALIGKYLNGYTNREAGLDYVPPGWDEWYAGADHAAYDSYNYTLNENGELVRYGSGAGDYLTDVLAGKAVDFVERASDRNDPFFLFLTPYAPHSPANPAPRHAGAFPDAKAPRPPSFDERNVRDKPDWVRQTSRISPSQQAKVDDKYRQRLRSLLAVDEMVGDLVQTLAGQGILDETYIFFTSDNGIHQGEHRQPHGKQSPYEEAIRVPLVVRGPGVGDGVDADGLALNIDLAPTIADLGGVGTPGFVDGRSLAPLFDRGAWPRRAVLIEDIGSDRRSEERDEGGPPVPPFRAIRTDELIYVEYETGERELYDLDRDPFETENVVDRADRATLSELSAQLAALAGCAGASCRSNENAEPPQVGKLAGKAERDRGRDARSARGDRRNDERAGDDKGRDRKDGKRDRKDGKRDRDKRDKQRADKDRRHDRRDDRQRDRRRPDRRSDQQTSFTIAWSMVPTGSDAIRWRGKQPLPRGWAIG